MGGIVTYVLELKRPRPPEPARTGSVVLQRRLASAAVGCPAGVHIAPGVQVHAPRAVRPGRRCQSVPEGGRRPPGPPGRGPIRAARLAGRRGRSAAAPGFGPTRPTRAGLGPPPRLKSSEREPVCWPFGGEAFV